MLRFFFAALCLLSLVAGNAMSTSALADDPVYELRIYTSNPDKLDALNERFRNHTLKLFERHGMKNIGYWIPTEPPLAGTHLIYLLEHASRDAAKASWQAFLNDPEWKQVAADSEKQHGKILAKKPESIFLAKTDYSTKIGNPDREKTYVLREYTTPEGKLDYLNARFRDHTLELFKKYGLESYGYWVPVDLPQSGNTLIYLLEVPSKEAAEKSFAEFRADPVWQEVKKTTEKDGPLTTQPPQSLFLKVADYSPVK